MRAVGLRGTGPRATMRGQLGEGLRGIGPRATMYERPPGLDAVPCSRGTGPRATVRGQLGEGVS